MTQTRSRMGAARERRPNASAFNAWTPTAAGPLSATIERSCPLSDCPKADVARACFGSGVRFRLVRADAPLPCFGPRRRRGRYSAGRCQWWKCGEHRRTRCAPRTTDKSSSPSRFRPGSPASAPKQPTSLPARPDDPRHEGAAGPVRGREISGRRLDADAQAVSRGCYHCLGNIASNIKDLAASGRLFLWVKLAPDRVQ